LKVLKVPRVYKVPRVSKVLKVSRVSIVPRVSKVLKVPRVSKISFAYYYKLPLMYKAFSLDLQYLIRTSKS